MNKEDNLQKLIFEKNRERQLQALKRMNEKKKNEIIKQSGYDIEEAILIEQEIYLKLLRWKEVKDGNDLLEKEGKKINKKIKGHELYKMIAEGTLKKDDKFIDQK